MALAVAQSQVAGSTTGSCAVVYPGALTAGSLLWVVCAMYQTGIPTLTVSDTATHTWTAVMAQQDNYDTHLRSWTAPNSGTATPTVTFDGDTTTPYWACVVVEITGQDSSTPLDGVTPVANTAAGSGPMTSGNITPGTSNAMVLGAATAQGSGADPTFTVANGFTLIKERETWNTDMVVATSYKIVSATTDAQWTVGGSLAGWHAHALVIRASAGVTALPPTGLRVAGAARLRSSLR